MAKAKTGEEKLYTIKESKGQSELNSNKSSTADAVEDQQSIGVFYQKVETPVPKSDTQYESFDGLNEESEKFASLRD